MPDGPVPDGKGGGGVRFALASLVAALVAGGCGREGPAPVPAPEERIGRFPISRFYLDRDEFLPADEPAAVPAAEAAFLAEDDEVFGVVVAGRARAYPIPMIAYHHVVNDVIEGVPVAVTY